MAAEANTDDRPIGHRVVAKPPETGRTARLAAQCDHSGFRGLSTAVRNYGDVFSCRRTLWPAGEFDKQPSEVAAREGPLKGSTFVGNHRRVGGRGEVMPELQAREPEQQGGE
jgi:hypothetical protein